MIATPATVRPPEQPIHTAFARECRRILFARETAGDSTGPFSLEAELDALLDKFIEASEFTPAEVNELHGLVAAERARLTDAVALADLLAPRIASLLKNALGTAPSPTGPAGKAHTPQPVQPMPPESPTASTPPAPRASAPRPRAPSPSAQPPGIADLIDGMLDQERNAPRPFQPTHR